MGLDAECEKHREQQGEVLGQENQGYAANQEKLLPWADRQENH